MNSKVQKKGKNKYQKKILWFHVRHINPSNKYQKRIKKTDKKIAEKLDYDGIEFPVQEKDFSKIEVKNNLCINVFGYKNELVFPIYVSDQKFEDSMDLLILIDDDKLHYVYLKDLDRLCFTKQKIKTKNGFVEGLYSVLVVKMSVCSCHVMYAFESESTLYSCLNVKELLARSRREI